MLEEKKELTIKQLINFIQAYRKCSDSDMTLSELILRCFNDDMMFDSWFNHINVMD